MDHALTSWHAAVLLLLTWIDLRQHVLPDGIVLPAIGVALASATPDAGPGLGSALLGGDAKMAGLVGTIAGVPGIFGPSLLATVCAAVAAGS